MFLKLAVMSNETALNGSFVHFMQPRRQSGVEADGLGEEEMMSRMCPGNLVF